MMFFTCTINFLIFIEIYLNSDQASKWNFIFQKTIFFYKLINSIFGGKICLLLIYNGYIFFSFYFCENEGISKFVNGLNWLGKLHGMFQKRLGY